MGFAVERTSGPDGVCVAVAGEVDIDTAPRLRLALAAALQEASQVVVDLGAVTFLDSAGLSTLIATHQRAEATGVSLRLQRVPPMVLRLLALTGMDSLLLITPASAEGEPG
jgi:anti-sigma B factor antagonist